MTPPRQAVELAALAKALYDMAANLDMVDSYNAEEAARTLLRQADTLAANAAEIERLTKALQIAVNRIEASLQDCRNGIRIAELTDDGPLKQKCIATGLDLERLLEKIRRAQQPSGEG
jgi:sugar/nucleoside kinase (ribokinase family)